MDGAAPSVYRPPPFSTLLVGRFRLTGTSSLLSSVAYQSLVHAVGILLAEENRPAIPFDSCQRVAVLGALYLEGWLRKFLLT